METYLECCFWDVHPTEIRVGLHTFQRVLEITQRWTNFEDATIRPNRDTPEGILHFYVPENDEKYGALLYLKESSK
jgi:hypothetical protein